MNRVQPSEAAFQPRIVPSVVRERKLAHIAAAARQEPTLMYTGRDIANLEESRDWIRNAPHRLSRRAIVIGVDNTEYQLPPYSGVLPYTVSEGLSHAVISLLGIDPQRGPVTLGPAYFSDRLTPELQSRVAASIAETLGKSCLIVPRHTRVCCTAGEAALRAFQDNIGPHMAQQIPIELK